MLDRHIFMYPKIMVIKLFFNCQIKNFIWEFLAVVSGRALSLLTLISLLIGYKVLKQYGRCWRTPLVYFLYIPFRVEQRFSPVSSTILMSTYTASTNHCGSSLLLQYFIGRMYVILR